MNKWISIALILTALLVFAIIFTVVRANSAAFVVPPAKQTIEAHDRIVEATKAAIAAHVTKYPELNPMVEPTSCPAPTPDRPNVIYSLADNPTINLPFSGGNFVNTVTAKSSTGNYYWMWAGSPYERGEPTPVIKQGLIRVILILADPCASHALGTQEPGLVDYLAPKGPLTFTKVEGDVIFYNIAGGGSGRFNFVKGKFLP